MALVRCLGICEDTIENALWRETSDRRLESHDAAEPVGRMCKLMVPEMIPPHYLVHKDRMELPRPKPSALPATD